VGKAEAKEGLFLALHDRFMERLINNRWALVPQRYWSGSGFV
jgi:hypothetical protein